MGNVIVLDFDGVVVRQSEFFKWESWPAVFAAYGEKGMEAFRTAEKVYGGGRRGDRFDILQHAYELLGESAEKIPSLVQTGARVFDEQVQKKIFDAGVTSEDRRVLTQWKNNGDQLYLNSATPKEALERTIVNLGLDAIFSSDHVLGRPRSKVENFQFVTTSEGISTTDILFVGDSDSDYTAAQEFGCRFVGFANNWNKWAGTEKPFPLIGSLSEIEERQQ